MAKKKSRPVPGWDDYFMLLCFIVASRSKDPSTQVGAVLVDSKKRLRSTGYNGVPKEISDNDIDWSRPAKYPFIVHAEENAIHNLPGGLDQMDGCTMYVSGPPCSKCALRIVNKGIRKVIYGPQVAACVDDEDWALTREMFRLSKFDLVRYAGNLSWGRDRMCWMERSHPFMFESQATLPAASP